MNSIIKRVRVGTVITDDIDKRRYCVAKVYPFMVLAYQITEDSSIIRRCFSYGDLVVKGLERDRIDYRGVSF